MVRTVHALLEVGADPWALVLRVGDRAGVAVPVGVAKVNRFHCAAAIVVVVVLGVAVLPRRTREISGGRAWEREGSEGHTSKQQPPLKCVPLSTAYIDSGSLPVAMLVVLSTW